MNTNRKKQLLVNAWAITTFTFLLGLVIYAGCIEWTQDLTRKRMFTMYFVDWAPWSYIILGNALVFIIYMRRT